MPKLRQRCMQWARQEQTRITMSPRGCHVFLSNITATKDEDKSKGKQLEDLPVVQEFPKVLPEDLSGKANVVANALSRKERVPLRVRALVMTIGLDLPKQILKAQTERKPIEFQVGDKVMLKVSPWKGVVHFGKQWKLNPRYVRPFKVLKKVEAVAYKLELPQELSRVHNTFH
nr:reverse transcriptase domain-containing protein [Tanacetum cinerariifolium]GFA30560.1 reverse transcriptase domain-containing protein [Tanacetum cinerariifolium]